MQGDNLARDLEQADGSSEDTLTGRYLTFRLGKEDYGLEIRFVTEIIGIQNIISVPDLPYAMKGVINLRGKVIPVMDVRLRFGIEERAYDERTCVIVVQVNSHSVGLVVDKVKEVMTIPEVQTEPLPQGGCKSSSYVQGIGKVGEEVKILLDVVVLLSEEGAG